VRFTIQILPSAEADLEDIAINMGSYSVTAFEKLVAALQRRFKVLSQFPEAGKSCDDLAKGVRVVFVKGHAVYHRLAGDSVEIVRIVDGRRDLTTVWNEES
jgi:toxin ParE1/3/4